MFRGKGLVANLVKLSCEGEGEVEADANVQSLGIQLDPVRFFFFLVTR